MKDNSRNKRKKLLIVITKSNWGGAQRYVYDLATRLPPSAYDVVVALGGAGELKTRLEKAGVRTFGIASLQRDISLLKELRVARELYALMRKERPDILHINSSKAGVLGSIVGRLARVPYIVFTAHGWAFNEDRPFLQKLLLKILHWKTVLLAHHTIAVSEGLKSQLTLPFAQRKMTVVHLGRAEINFIPKSEARDMLWKKSSAMPPINPADLVIGSIGELHPIKRFGLLITTIKKINATTPIYLYIIGEGEERDNLEKTIISEGLSNRVFLVGTIQEAARLLPAFDIFVLPSKSESFGYVVVEAALAGLPIIASRVGGIPEIISNETDSILIKPDDSEALKNALQLLCDNPAQRTKLGVAARRQAEKFSITTMVEKTIAVYEAKSSRD